MSELVAKRIEGLLKENGLQHEIMEHGPVFTSEQAAEARGVELKTGVKALVLKTADGTFLVGLCPADRRLDLKLIARLAGVKKVSLASPEEVKKLTDCEVGSVPPFGFRKKMRTYMDRGVLENEWVNFNIGLHTRSARMRAKDLEELIRPTLF